MSRRCIAVLGGSFDPVHNGHVALGTYFARLLGTDELRIIPAGDPWQKPGLHASSSDRLSMLKEAFLGQQIAATIDPQEVVRANPTYTIDTLRPLRQELGPEPSISLLIGADQLLRLDTWREWHKIFDHAHLCVASRPGFATDAHQLPPAVETLFSQRLGTVQQLREQPHGLSFLACELSVDISATSIRTTLTAGREPEALIPAPVLDYIKHHNLYKRR